MWHIFYIAAGGAAGALCRYGLSEAITNHAGKGFPWGILSANLLGCFLIGLGMHLVTAQRIPHELSWLIITGFLGAFTTFSTFSWETLTMVKDGAYLPAVTYVLVSVLAGLGLCGLGLWIGHLIHQAMLR